MPEPTVFPDLSSEEGVPLEGQVLCSATGRPVTGLELLFLTPDHQRFVLATDAEGVFASDHPVRFGWVGVSSLDPDAVKLLHSDDFLYEGRLRLDDPEAANRFFSSRGQGSIEFQHEARSPLDEPLVLRAEVGPRFRLDSLPDSFAIGDVVLSFLLDDVDEGWAPDTGRRSARVDPETRIAAFPIDTRRGWGRLVVSEEGGSRKAIAEVDVGPGEHAPVLDIAEVGSLLVSATWASGRPAAGDQVRLLATWRPPVSSSDVQEGSVLVDHGVLDNLGRWRSEGLVPGRYLVFVHRGFWSSEAQKGYGRAVASALPGILRESGFSECWIQPGEETRVSIVAGSPLPRGGVVEARVVLDASYSDPVPPEGVGLRLRRISPFADGTHGVIYGRAENLRAHAYVKPPVVEGHLATYRFEDLPDGEYLLDVDHGPPWVLPPSVEVRPDGAPVEFRVFEEGPGRPVRVVHATTGDPVSSPVLLVPRPRRVVSILPTRRHGGAPAPGVLTVDAPFGLDWSGVVLARGFAPAPLRSSDLDSGGTTIRLEPGAYETSLGGVDPWKVLLSDGPGPAELEEIWKAIEAWCAGRGRQGRISGESGG